mmetsp:Transcript_11721/g.40493  ORF Transcript_11721/g.40493 Transcript_11721/m.40493 type:complete len:163 (-) Transcript_11721:49-537(-)
MITMAGQPCCALQWTIPIAASVTLNALKTRVFNASSSGGYDGRFSLVSISPPDLLEGSFSSSFYSCSAAALLGPSAAGTLPCVLVQGEHRPAGSRMVKYTDKLNFAIFSSSKNETTLKAFIISPFILSTCDGGSNYQTLQNIILQLGVPSYTQSTLYGCPQK